MKSKIIIQPSKKFRTSILKVLLAIISFFLLYIALVVAAIALLILCIHIAAIVISAGLGYVTLVLGAGLIALGVMFLVFLIKFVFAKHRDQNPYRIQLFAKDYPELFQFIGEVAKEVGTHFPKKVYIRHDVNASVFYSSSFWSLFFPVRKNLDIGLGLVNSISRGELKSVLAHEFGHFSQKSMRLGSYVYTVNSVIYNLVYEYDKWDRSLRTWAKAGGLFALFAVITYWMVEVVRMILRNAYTLINIPYMGLSREMEYHADEIAARVSGKGSMISSLRRIEFSDIAFNRTLEFLGQVGDSNRISENIYENHTYNLKRISTRLHMNLDRDLPVITEKILEENTVKPRVIFKNQWASHPSREEREKRIHEIAADEVQADRSSAWKLFGNFAELQKKMTDHVYDIRYRQKKPKDLEEIDNTVFIELQEQELNKFVIPEIYNDFYTNRLFYITDPEKIAESSPGMDIGSEFEKLYSQSTKLKFEKIRYDQNDLTTLKQIKNRTIKTKYFEFDNKKFRRRKINGVISALSKEIENSKIELKALDEKAFLLNFQLCMQVSTEAKNEFVDFYKKIISLQKDIENNNEFLDKLAEYSNTLHSKTKWKQEELVEFNRQLSNFEQKYKVHLRTVDLEGLEGFTEQQTQVLDSFLNGKMYYLSMAKFNGNAFNNFTGFVYFIHNILHQNFFTTLKSLATFQTSVYEQTGLKNDNPHNS